MVRILRHLKILRQVCFGQGRVELALRRKGHGQVSIKTHGLFYVIRPCNGLDTIVSNGRKKTMFCLLLDTAVKTVAYRWQVIQIVETLVHSPDPLHPYQRGHRVRRLAGPADQGDDRRRLLCCISTPIWSLPYIAPWTPQTQDKEVRWTEMMTRLPKSPRGMRSPRSATSSPLQCPRH